VKGGFPEDLELTDGVLILRRWSAADIDDLTTIWQDDELQRRFGVEPPVTTGSITAYIEGVAARWRDGVQVSLAVTVDGTLVGGCDLDHLDTEQPDLGYWLASDARGRGHATRAARLLLDWAAAGLGVTEVRIEVEPDNRASIAVGERLGFTPRATRRHDGTRVFVVYGLTRAPSGPAT
jgi:RimJ/RimL family protein N-acetyltransferase